ncbi:alpha/beta hydrolase [Pararoseomonas indoligenes]|uniref:Alpha/beta hydrolase n=1 Tax=Roseomonas indoligenes TaxID=2820811 RepID=A0A940N1C9_9PROT|nr:alpha/beta hydrolase [Pararoseomonas indoligenes]MBP0496131.1 alpha/beta hydrolase [Pararoseomonas indoligenes]
MTDSNAWRGWDRATLSAAYNNNAAVPTGSETVEGWAAASATLRAARPEGLDQLYGSTPRQGWDLFPAARADAPCLVFIHGGYWQRNSRERFTCIVEGALARGWSAALPSHTLAPDASMTVIAAEMRQAMDWLQANGPAKGIAGPVVLSGWSAGGHLAALLADHPAVTAALAISGIHDLGPIQGTGLNDALQLTAEEIAAFSPQFLPVSPKPITVAYGAEELPELRRQSQEFHARRAAAGAPGPLLAVEGADHFSVLDHLRRPDGALLAAAESLLRA